MQVLRLENYRIFDCEIIPWLHFKDLTLILRVDEKILASVSYHEWFRELYHVLVEFGAIIIHNQFVHYGILQSETGTPDPLFIFSILPLFIVLIWDR